MASATSGSREQPLGQAKLSILSWGEPLIVLGAMLTAVVVSRRRNYSILPRKPRAPNSRHPSPGGASCSSEDTLVDSEAYENSLDGDEALLMQPAIYPKRTASLARTAEQTGPYSNLIHSRFLQKFPFFIEMWYWALNYAAYQLSKQAAEKFHSMGGGGENVQLAQDHGIGILKFEHESILSILFAAKEIDVQQFFLNNHVGLMTIFNQIYSLVHIPGTVAFICWYYVAAPSFSQFSVARRTMALANFVAFSIFIVWPCMPPRLLPESFGFQDTVRQAHAESVWTGVDGQGQNFNQLAAMPSLHITYALIIGTTLFWHSGFLQSLGGKPRERSLPATVALMLAGVCYPMLVLLVIVATANHYYMDAVAAIFSTLFCFLCNRVWFLLIPAQQFACRVLHVEQPYPTTGDFRRSRRHAHSSRRPIEMEIA